MLKKLISTVQKWFPMREAAGATAFANEDVNWTPLTNDTKRDLMPYDQRRMQDMAGYQWAYNPIANRIIELKVAHLLGGGVSWKVETDDQQLHDLLEQKIKDFWTYPTNQIDKFLIQLVRELGIYGDVCLPMFSTGLGSVRIGYIPAYHIEDIIVSTDGRTPLVVKTTMNARGKQFFLKVIYDKPDEELFTSTHDLMHRQMATDGECFYFAINTLIGSKRGRSDLAASFDWLDSYEQFMFGEMERAHLSRLFLWDVTLNGASKEDCETRARNIPKPQPNGIRVHNENEIWKAEAPSMGAYESTAAARLFRNHILAGNTIPEHWIGGGGEANRATAEAMDDPTYKIFSMRQKELKYMVEQIINYVGRQYFDFIGLSRQAIPEICAVFPEMNPKDNSRYAAAFQQLTQAVVMGLDKNLIAPETALDILNTIASQMGVDIDAAMELEKAQNAMLNQAQNDLYSEEPAVTDDAVA